MLLFALYIAVANAAAVTLNATSQRTLSDNAPIITSPASLPSSVSSPDGIITTDCMGTMFGQDCDRSGLPQYDYYLTNYNNPYSAVHQNINGGPLSESCGTIWTSSFLEWMATVPLTSGTQITPAWTMVYGSTFVYPAHSVVGFTTPFAFTASAPCCSSCTIFGGSAQVYYWPTPAPTPAVSLLIDTALNLTFTSPSIYVGFQSLYASNLCGTLQSKVYSSTMLSFAPDELSTATAWSWNTSAGIGNLPTGFAKATFGDQKDCVYITTTFDQMPGSTALLPIETSVPYTFTNEISQAEGRYQFVAWYNPCSPLLSVPTEIYNINSLWTGCSTGLSAFFDPPYTLTTGGSLVPFAHSMPTTAIPVSTSVAAAGLSVPTITPVRTTIPRPDPTPTPIPTPILIKDPLTQSPPISSDPRPAQTPKVTVDPSIPLSAPAPAEDPSTPLPSRASGEPPPQISSTAVGPLAISSLSTAVIFQPIQEPSPTTSNPGPQTPANDPPAASNPPPASNSPTANDPPIPSNYSPADPSTPSDVVTGIDSTTQLASDGSTLSIGGISVQVLHTTAYLIGSQTLSAGGAAVVASGTTYSLESGGASVVVGDSTQAVGAVSAIRTVGTFLQTPEYIIASQTLVVGGPAITVSGTLLSLMEGGSIVVLGGSTTAALSAVLGSSTTSVQGLGGLIVTIGGFGNTDSSVTSSHVQSTGFPAFNGTVFQGAAPGREKRNVWKRGLIIGMSIMAVGWT